MSLDLNEICAKLNGEQVGDRVIVVHEGKKQYVTDNDGGHFFLNELGVLLMQEAAMKAVPAEAPVAEAPAEPARKTKKSKPVETLGLDDVNIELE